LDDKACGRKCIEQGLSLSNGLSREGAADNLSGKCSMGGSNFHIRQFQIQ